MASLRDKLRSRLEPMLEPGEQVQQVFLAQSGPNPNLIFLTYLVMFFAQYKIVAVTDRAIVVFRASKMKPASPLEMAARLPRQTKLGPASGGLYSKVNLGGEKPSWVHRRFYKDVNDADQALTA